MRDNDHLLAANSTRWRNLNRPPYSEANPELAWGWLTVEMLTSDAWRALSGPAVMVLMRILVEHVSHGGGENGELIVTYDDFVAYDVRRGSIRPAIALLVKLGWIDVEAPGRFGCGIGRRAARYRLTWLPMRDGAPATNRWKSYRAGPASRRPPSRNILSSDGIDTRAEPGTAGLEGRSSIENDTRSSIENDTRENEFEEAADAA